MKRFRFVPRGIVLISVMFIAVLVGMYVLSANILSQGQFGALKQYNESRLAEEAARSGIEYALARLQENPQWRGDGNGVIVDSPNFSVREDNGNVVGLIRSADGGIAQFRLRFNHQDGSGGGDGLDDPTGDMAFDSRPISVNNLLGGVPVNFYLGDGPNGRANTILPHQVPAGMVALVCEGRVAPEFQQATAASPNPASPRLQSVRTIEEIHRVEGVDGLLPVVDAVSMAGDRFDARLFNDGVIDLYDISGGKARMRARDQIRVNNGSGVIVGPNGEVMVPNSNPEAVLQGGVSPGEEDLNTAFYELAWDQVKEPRADAGVMPAGVYVYQEGSGLLYFNMTHSEYMTQASQDLSLLLLQAVPAESVLPDGVEFVPAGQAGPDGVTVATRDRLVVFDDVWIEATANTDELTIMPRSGAKESASEAGGEGGEGPPGGYHGIGLGGGAPVDYIAAFAGDPSQGVNNQFLNIINEVHGDDVAGGLLNQFLTEFAHDGGIEIELPGYPELFTLDWEYSDGDWEIEVDGNGLSSPQNFMAMFFTNQEMWNTTLFFKNLENPNTALLGGDDDVYITIADLVQNFMGGGGGGGNPNAFQLLDLDGDDTNPGDFEMTFAPKDSNGLRLQGPGDIRLATDVRGQGASIKAEGQIRVVGVGMEMDAAVGEGAPSVSFYAKGDIVVSTLRPNEGGDFEYLGLDLKGILYSWRNIELKSAEEDYPSPGVRIQGTMVAYGGDPSVDKPGEGGGGKIALDGENVDLIFDPSYLIGLTGGEGMTAVLGKVSTSYRN